MIARSLKKKAPAVTQPIETCACPLCASDDPRPTPYGAAAFRVVRCADCRLWYLSPRLPGPAMIDRYVNDDYFAGTGGGYTDYAAQERSLRRTFRRLLRRLASADLTGGDVLEVGCGFGYFLDEAAGHFKARTGVEMSPAAAHHAARTGNTIITGGLDAVPDGLRVDAVVAFHVIEHIYDPHAFLAQARRFLRPGGTMVLAAPDMAGFWRHALGRRWPSFKIPEHVAFYDRQTLATLMYRAGLVDLQPIPYLHDFPLGEIVGKAGLLLPAPLAQTPIPLPATTVCLAGRVPAKQ